MKQSISKVDDLVFKEIEIPESAYLAYCDKFKTEQDAINTLEFRIEHTLRRQRRLIYNKVTPRRRKLTIGINPHLIPILESYCAIKGLSMNDFVILIMKWTRLRKQ